MATTAIALTVSGVLGGCAAFGEPDYGCKGLPEGVSCKSARQVYEMDAARGRQIAGQMWEEWVRTKTGVPPAAVPPMPDDPHIAVPASRRPAAGPEGDPDSVVDGDHEVHAVARATAGKARVVSDTGAGPSAAVVPAVVPPMPRVASPAARWRAPALPQGPVPVRSPAQVMRIWVAAWEDTNGDLIVPGYVYTEIEPRRWEFGLPSVGGVSRRVFTPTAVRVSGPSPSAASRGGATKGRSRDDSASGDPLRDRSGSGDLR